MLGRLPPRVKWACLPILAGSGSTPRSASGAQSGRGHRQSIATQPGPLPSREAQRRPTVSAGRARARPRASPRPAVPRPTVSRRACRHDTLRRCAPDHCRRPASRTVAVRIIKGRDYYDGAGHDVYTDIRFVRDRRELAGAPIDVPTVFERHRGQRRDDTLTFFALVVAGEVIPGAIHRAVPEPDRAPTCARSTTRGKRSRRCSPPGPARSVGATGAPGTRPTPTPSWRAAARVPGRAGWPSTRSSPASSRG